MSRKNNNDKKQSNFNYFSFYWLLVAFDALKYIFNLIVSAKEAPLLHDKSVEELADWIDGERSKSQNKGQQKTNKIRPEKILNNNANNGELTNTRLEEEKKPVLNQNKSHIGDVINQPRAVKKNKTKKRKNKSSRSLSTFEIMEPCEPVSVKKESKIIDNNNEKKQQTTMSLAEFPIELIYHIFSFLSNDMLRQLATVSKNFNKIICEGFNNKPGFFKKLSFIGYMLDTIQSVGGFENARKQPLLNEIIGFSRKSVLPVRVQVVKFLKQQANSKLEPVDIEKRLLKFCQAVTTKKWNAYEVDEAKLMGLLTEFKIHILKQNRFPYRLVMRVEKYDSLTEVYQHWNVNSGNNNVSFLVGPHETALYEVGGFVPVLGSEGSIVTFLMIPEQNFNQDQYQRDSQLPDKYVFIERQHRSAKRKLAYLSDRKISFDKSWHIVSMRVHDQFEENLTASDKDFFDKLGISTEITKYLCELRSNLPINRPS